jgi:hypothetical protein
MSVTIFEYSLSTVALDVIVIAILVQIYQTFKKLNFRIDHINDYIFHTLVNMNYLFQSIFMLSCLKKSKGIFKIL